jgi:hypothetical protein
MEAVLNGMAAQVPLWNAALNGQPDWQAIYAGFHSAVDWPTAGFFRELPKIYPTAKFVLTLRDPEKWADSFAATIYKLVGGREQAPPDKKAWLDMADGIIAKTGFPTGLDHDALVKAFIAHNEAVKATVPSRQLLVYEVKDGWYPLCSFLGVAPPAEPFPRTNHRAEFWDRVTGRI